MNRLQIIPFLFFYSIIYKWNILNEIFFPGGGTKRGENNLLGHYEHKSYTECPEKC